LKFFFEKRGREGKGKEEEGKESVPRPSSGPGGGKKKQLQGTESNKDPPRVKAEGREGNLKKKLAGKDGRLVFLYQIGRSKSLKKQKGRAREVEK